jgi:hypothetical protein
MRDKTFAELIRDKTSRELAQILIDQMNGVRAGTITPEEAVAVRKAVRKEVARRRREA